jgi:hypothetical protein
MDGSPLVIHADRRLADQVERLAGQRMVFLAGLPGTGKSLLVHQLAHVAAARGRRVQLLQWDVARPVFEATPAGRRYPVVDGVTHAVIRRAAGLWVRRAVVDWSARHPADVLIGETPFVGGRFVELARRVDDEAEPLLAAASCRFAIAVPSVEVRRFLEVQRERRASAPLHPREREDAPPPVLRALWKELVEVGHRLGLPSASGHGDYDPQVYRRVYERVLRYRHVDVVPLDTVLPTEGMSVYDYAAAPEDLTPTAADAERFIGEVDRRYPEVGELELEADRWWDV